MAARQDFDVNVDPVEIANRLGVVVPPDHNTSDLRQLGVTNIRFDPNVNSWGIAPTRSKLNSLLAETASLECQFEPIETFEDWEFADRLVALAKSARHPIVGFEYRSLFGGIALPSEGHCAVVNGAQTRTSRILIEIYDPDAHGSRSQIVDPASLYVACRKKRGGIWLLIPTKS